MRWLFLTLFSLCASALAQDIAPTADTGDDKAQLEVSLLTYGPGEIYWERFGHNAIVIHDRATGESTSYNYGIFDFEEEDFFLNFVRGHMTYQIAANPMAEDVAIYAAEGRSVTEQKLNLTQKQAQALHDYLQWNLRPENQRYRYDYFTSNCSTKLRDALDQALGGNLRPQLISPSRGYTFRLKAGALTSPAPLLMGAIDIGLGPYADRRLSFWDDSFVPMELMTHMRDVKLKNEAGIAYPLVVSERVISPARFKSPPELPPDLRWSFLIAGVTFAALLLVTSSRAEKAWARRSFAIAATTFSIACALVGLVLAGLWAFTHHQSAWRNENLMVMSPLSLLLIPTFWRYARGHVVTSAFARSVALVIAVVGVFALFAKVLPWFAQANLHWILLVLPAHLVIAYAMQRRDPMTLEGSRAPAQPD